MKENREIFVRTEVRAKKEGDKRTVSGVIPYNKDSEDMGFIEVIKPGAFTKSLKEKDIRALWNHSPQHILGRSKNGSLSLSDKEDGLHFEIKLPEARQYALDVYDVIESGDAEGVSFGFRTIKQNWIDEDDQPLRRELQEVALFEVSVGVTFPAYPDAAAQTREIKDYTGLDLEKLLKRSQKADLSAEEREALSGLIDGIKKRMDERPAEPESQSQDHHSENEPESREEDLHSVTEPVDTTLMRMKLDLFENS